MVQGCYFGKTSGCPCCGNIDCPRTSEAITESGRKILNEFINSFLTSTITQANFDFVGSRRFVRGTDEKGERISTEAITDIYIKTVDGQFIKVELQL